MTSTMHPSPFVAPERPAPGRAAIAVTGCETCSDRPGSPRSPTSMHRYFGAFRDPQAGMRREWQSNLTCASLASKCPTDGFKLLVPKPGLEPGRGVTPLVFETSASTIPPLRRFIGYYSKWNNPKWSGSCSGMSQQVRTAGRGSCSCGDTRID